MPRQSSGSAEFTVDTKDFRTLFSRSSQVEPKLRTALRRRIRNAAKGLAEEVKAEALKPGEGSQRREGILRRKVYRAGAGRSTGLRQGIADSVKVNILTGSTRQGVRITANGTLAGAWQGKGWRHPVFEDRETWVAQRGRPGYFHKTIGHGSARVREAVEAAMQEAADSLKGAS